MNDETGSVMNFFYQVFPVVCYEKEIPDHFQIPSLYFPPPSVFDENDTVSTFKKVFTLNVKLFHHDSQQAHDHAERIADAVREARHIIPLIDRSGKGTGDSLRISPDRDENRGFRHRVHYYSMEQPLLVQTGKRTFSGNN